MAVACTQDTSHAVMMALRLAWHKAGMRSAPAGKTLWTTITSHIQPHLCALSALADLLLFNILHMELPVPQLISRGATPAGASCTCCGRTWRPACNSWSTASWQAS